MTGSTSRIAATRQWRRLSAAAVTLALFGALVSSARADVRVFERGVDEDGEVVERRHMFLDLTAFTQPGFIFRFADQNAGRQDNTPLLQRARMGINAKLQWWLRMRTEVEFAPTPLLQDAYLEFMPIQYAHFRIGQFQVPFLRAYQFNELNLGFIDRPIYTPLGSINRSFLRYLSPRDIGFMITGRVGDVSPGATMPVFEYYLGAFLGRGANAVTNDDNAFLYALRLQLHILGVPEGVQSESDIVRNSHPRVSVGGSLYSNCDDRQNWNRGVNFDAEFRWQGLYASGALVWFHNGPVLDSPELGSDFDGHPNLGYNDFCGYQPDADVTAETATLPYEFVSRGVHLQLQYVLPDLLFPFGDHRLEILARFDWTDPNTVLPSRGGEDIFIGGGQDTPGYAAPSVLNDSDNAATRYRVTLGLNWFPTGSQELRIQVNYQINRELEDLVTANDIIRGVRNELLWFQITAGI